MANKKIPKNKNKVQHKGRLLFTLKIFFEAVIACGLILLLPVRQNYYNGTNNSVSLYQVLLNDPKGCIVIIGLLMFCAIVYICIRIIKEQI